MHSGKMCYNDVLPCFFSRQKLSNEVHLMVYFLSHLHSSDSLLLKPVFFFTVEAASARSWFSVVGLVFLDQWVRVGEGNIFLCYIDEACKTVLFQGPFHKM